MKYNFEDWDIEITPNKNYLNLDIKNLWKYKDLLFLLIRRDFVSFYKQTVFGPIWFFIQPFFTTITFIFIFGRLAGIPTEGTPPVLFYLAGISSWNYFSDSILKISTVLRDNSNILGKVYFPRLILPLSIICSGFLKYLLQLFIFLIIYLFYTYNKNFHSGNIQFILIPVYIFFLSAQSLGFGLLISGLTTKYRDLAMLLSFGIQIILYLTPIAYPMSSLNEQTSFYISLNPLSYLFEGIRYSFFGKGFFSFQTLFVSFFTTLLILITGLLVFNRAEKTFIDTI